MMQMPGMPGAAQPNPVAQQQIIMQALIAQNPALAQNPAMLQALMQQAMMQQMQGGQAAAGMRPPMGAAQPAGGMTQPMGGMTQPMGGMGMEKGMGKGMPMGGAAAPKAPMQSTPMGCSGCGGCGGMPTKSSAENLPDAKPPPGMVPFDAEKAAAMQTKSSGDGGGIDKSEVVKILDPDGNQVMIEPFDLFVNCPFPQTLIQEITKAGFTKPSQIQGYSWPIALQGNDVIGVAATGSGKTVAFLFPSFMHILNNCKGIRDPILLTLAPTRELAVQIEREAQRFGQTSGINTVCCYGGAPKGDQLRALSRGCQCLIATPGRLNDFLEARQVRLDQVCKLVLDEADRMLDMGFEPQIRKILKEVPAKRHTLFFTATWPKEVRKLAEDFLNRPYQVQIGNREELKANADITQVVRLVEQFEKPKMLDRTLREHNLHADLNARGLVFCATKRLCDQLERDLQRSGYRCNAIHGDKDQRQRDQALDDFRGGRINLLAATDVAARGLDIKGVVLVINYDPAGNTEDHVHRIGRTGRAGQKGTAVTFLTSNEGNKARGIIEVMEKTQQVIPDEIRALAASAPEKGKGKGPRFNEPKGKAAGKGDRDRSPPRGRPGGDRNDRRRSRSRSRRRSPSRRRSFSRRRRSSSRDKRKRRRSTSSSSSSSDKRQSKSSEDKDGKGSAAPASAARNALF